MPTLDFRKIEKYIDMADRSIWLFATFAFEILLFIISWKKFKGVIFSPSVYSIGTMIIGTALCIYCVNYWQINFFYGAFFVIILGQAAMILGELYSYKRYMPAYTEYINDDISCIMLPPILKIGLSLFCIVATYLYYREIQNIGLAFSMGVNEAIGNVKENFTEYEMYFNPFVRQGYKVVLSISYCYTYLFVNNYLICKRKLSESFWYILPLFCGLGINLLSGSRGELLRLLILFLFVYYISYWQKSGWRIQPTKKIVKIAVPNFALLIAIFFSARLFVKANVQTQEDIGGPIEYIAYYVGSPIEVLNTHTRDLSTHTEANNGASFGAITFNGFYDLFSAIGLIEKKDVIMPRTGFGFVILGGDANAAANVDTIFGIAHTEFGLLGMLIYIFLIYIIMSKILYKRILYMPFSPNYVKDFLFFSFFFYEIEMSFYSDVTYYIVSQTGLLQFICLYVIIHYVVKPKYFVPVDYEK